MNDSNVVKLRISALIIGLSPYVRDQYSKIRKALYNGSYINPEMRNKLHKRMKHCHRITREFARQNIHTYRFTLETSDSTKEVYGDPLRDFIPCWDACKDKMTYSISFTEPEPLSNPPTLVPLDYSLIVQ